MYEVYEVYEVYDEEEEARRHWSPPARMLLESRFPRLPGEMSDDAN